MSAILNSMKRLFFRQSPTWEPVDCKMVLVVRTDLEMGRGKIAAQCSHAAVECFRKVLRRNRCEQMYKSWIKSGQPKVVLKVSSRAQLIALMSAAQRADITYAVIRDAGKTQTKPGTLTAIGIGPGPTTEIDKLTGSLKLL